jgi:alpha-methylacyl-CoA racemase
LTGSAGWDRTTQVSAREGERKPGDGGAGLGQALQGVRVLDLSRLLPGPFASLVLADLGAEVDKVEEVGGDYLRHMPPQIGSGDATVSATFAALNRGKRSIALDLKKPGGRLALLAMLPRYDVLLEQFRPGVLERLGLAHAKLRATNPRLVVCALTGYGQTGPLAQRAGHDLNYLARAGVLGQQGPPEGPPAVPGFQLADVGGGLWSVLGILAALAQRARTGEGCVVDVAMIEASMGFAVAGFGQLGVKTVDRGNEALTGALAGYATYETKDGKHMSLGALEPKFLQAFCEGAGVPFDVTMLMPGPHQKAHKEQLAAVFRARRREEWEAFARDRDCCLEPVLAPEELDGDPHMTARKMFFTMGSPWGLLRQLWTPLADRDARPAPPPLLGEHTDAILREAGLDDATIAAMRADGTAR